MFAPAEYCQRFAKQEDLEKKEEEDEDEDEEEDDDYDDYDDDEEMAGPTDL